MQVCIIYIYIYMCIYNHIITHNYTSQIAAVVPTWAWDGLGGSGGPSSPLWYPCTLACSSQLLGFSCSNSNRIQRNLFGLRHWEPCQVFSFLLERLRKLWLLSVPWWSYVGWMCGMVVHQWNPCNGIQILNLCGLVTIPRKSLHYGASGLCKRKDLYKA